MTSVSRSLFLLPPPFALIPQTVNSKIFTAMFNQVFSRSLEDDDLCFLEGRFLTIEVLDIGLSFSVGLKSNSLVAGNKHTSTDLTISANSCDFLSMIARKKDPDTLFFQRKIKMQGSTELGIYVKNFLDAFDVDSSWISSIIDRTIQLSYPLLSLALCNNK
ncbi:MAG TPA: sterol-binding protein [Gammaproteobacteria bacterium]|jgi:predicted lipid carrier protein YhbT|nr:sterol-binding protein [Gammaproteobacteria bacterium]|tara:strand:+ start:1096 stop:1578 length:483 start_codon:yes stop_codon:yes gene_type:complete